MSDEQKAMTLADIEEKFGEKPLQMTTDIPEGADPDATGYMDPPVGFHVFEVLEAEIHRNKDWKDSGETYYCTQLRPRFVIPKDQPYAGSSIIDFLPMPLAGERVSTRLMNRWLNFLKGAGFVVPQGASAPQGFTPIHIKRKQVVIKIVNDIDQDKNQKLKDDGTPQVKVAFFGYYPMSKLAELQARNPHTSSDGPAKKRTGATAGTKESVAAKDFAL